MAVTVEIALAGNGDDTNGRKVSNTGWANIAAATYLDNPDTDPTLLGVSKANWSTDTYASAAVYMRFNSGGTLPDNAIVISASLKLYVVDVFGPNAVDYAADFYDYGGSPSVDADWEVSSSGNAVATINGATLTETAVNTIPLTGLTGVSTTGYTGVRISAKTATAPVTDEYIDFAGMEHTTGQEPRLEITYILPGDCQAADIFDRTDGNLTAPYQTFADWSAMQIISNTVWGNGEPSGSIYTGVTFDNDQWADAIIAQTDGLANSGIGLMLRASSSSENCYTAVVAASGTIYIGKYVSGTYTPLANFAASFVDGERLRFEAEGTTLRVYRNQVLYGETTDSSHTSGYPGMCRINTSSVNMGSFFAGNLHSSPSIVGIAEVGALLASGSATAIVPPDAEFAVAMYANWDATPGLIDYIRLDGDDFTPQGLKPPVGGDPGCGILTMATLPAPGAYALTWSWLAGGNQDEGGKIVVVFLKDLHATSPFRDTGIDANDGINPVTVSLATAPGDFVLGVTQKYAGNPDPKAYALIDGASPYNAQHYDVGITAPGSGVSTLIPSGPPAYNSQTFISFPAQSQEESVVTVPIATANDDTYGTWTDSAGDWPPDQTFVDSQGQSSLWAWKQDQGASNSNASNIFLRFDTSAIPDGAVIESALLRMYATIDMEDANNVALVGDYYDFGGGASIAADWILTASPSIFSAVDLTSIVENAVNDIVFTDLTGINKTGYTGIRLTLSAYTPNFNHDAAVFASFENSLHYQEPRLTVTWTEDEEVVTAFALIPPFIR